MSSTVNNRGIHPSATLVPAHTDANGVRQKSRLQVEVDVNDPVVMQAVPGADHFEEVTVGLPYMKQGELAWKEVPLKYEGEEILGYYQRDLVSSHEGTVENVNTRELKKNGFYVKLAYDGGETIVWGQKPGENYAPVVRE